MCSITVFPFKNECLAVQLGAKKLYKHSSGFKKSILDFWLLKMVSASSAHIAHSFLVETEGSREERAKHTLTHMGPG